MTGKKHSVIRIDRDGHSLDVFEHRYEAEVYFNTQMNRSATVALFLFDPEYGLAAVALDGMVRVVVPVNDYVEVTNAGHP
jgi:hypothetical protein